MLLVIGIDRQHRSVLIEILIAAAQPRTFGDR